MNPNSTVKSGEKPTVDLLAALQASLERARQDRLDRQPSAATTAAETEPAAHRLVDEDLSAQDLRVACDASAIGSATSAAQAFLATHTPEQLELASLMDSLVSSVYFASCVTDEADSIYYDLVRYAQNPATSAINADSVETAEQAIALMRKLGGTWFGSGCLQLAAHAAKQLLDGAQRGDREDVLFFAEQLSYAATWVTLEEMAARTGWVLPA